MSALSSMAISQLRLINEIPMEFVDRAPTTDSVAQPKLAGRKVRVRGMSAIYVIDGQGYRRLVPFPLTFMNLFADRAAFHDILVSDDIADIAEGPALDDGAILVRGTHSEGVYLLDKRRKHLIAGRDVMARYDFEDKNVVVVPQIVLDSIPAGEDWQ